MKLNSSIQLGCVLISSSSLAAVIIALTGTSVLAQITIQSTGTLSGTIQLPRNNPNFNQSITRVDTDDTGTYSRNLNTKNNPTNYVPIYKSDYVQVKTRADGSMPTPAPIVSGDSTPTPASVISSDSISTLPKIVDGGSEFNIAPVVDGGSEFNIAPVVDSGNEFNIAPVVDSGSAITSPTPTTYTSGSNSPSLFTTPNMELSNGNSLEVNQVVVNPATLAQAACSQNSAKSCTTATSPKQAIGPRSRVLLR
ncbi:hypothetical protein [Nostoc sp.]|uniref:hypothetical protein n=1 Tax=Nostoc sp. TaxID=1180 RepID=UPI002FF4C66B